MSVRSSWFMVLLKSSVCFLISGLIVLSVIEKEVLNCPSIIVELYISPFNSVRFYFIYFGTLLGSYMYVYVVPSWWIDHFICINLYNVLFLLVTISILKFLLSNISIPTPAFFGLLLVWCIFFHFLTLNVLLPLNVKYVSCRC